MQGLKLSDGGTADLSDASEQHQDIRPNERAQVQAQERRNRRGNTDRRRTPNPVFEARARRVGMTLDRRGDAAGKKSARWAHALRDKCANWWRPMSTRQTAPLVQKAQVSDTQVELDHQDAVSGHGS